MRKTAVVYWSGTGNTQMMAEKVAEGVRAAGAEADVYNCTEFSADLMDNYEAVAFGVPDARLGAAIILIVRGKDGVSDEDGLAAYLRQNLPNFMQPQAIEWRGELPRNPNGKLDRVAIATEWDEAATT